VTAPPALPSLITLLEFLALPLTILGVIYAWGWWRDRHPARTDTEERP
jgi:hypothetical protein